MSARLLTTTFACFLCCAPAGHAAPPAASVAPEELHAPGGGRVWVYLPKSLPANAKLPCVLIPPAGTRMFHGMLVGESDKPEHLPWVSAGFAVVTFDLSGPWPEQVDMPHIAQAAAAFMKADFGVADAMAAWEVARGKYSQIDPQRLYVVGHSSAATLALQIAASSDQVKACVAFAPVANLGEALAKVLPSLDRRIPGFADAVVKASPSSRVEAFRCPIFLFHAADDSKVTTASVVAFRDALLAQHKTVEYVSVETGDHYDSMIQQGIPKAITWVKALDQKLPKQ